MNNCSYGAARAMAVRHLSAPSCKKTTDFGKSHHYLTTVLLVLILFCSCKKNIDNSSDDPGNPPEAGVVLAAPAILRAAEKILVYADQGGRLIKIINDSTVSIPAATDFMLLSEGRLVQSLATGDIIVSGRQQFLPYGIMGKITSISANGSASIVQITPQGLDDVFEALDFTWNMPFDGYDIKDQFSEKISAGSSGVFMSLTGSYQLDISGVTAGVIKNGALLTTSLGITGETTLTSEASMGYQENITKDTTILLQEYPLFESSSFEAGGFDFPLVIRAVVQVILHVTAQGTMTLSGSVTYRNKTSLQLSYQNMIPGLQGTLVSDNSDTTETSSVLQGDFKAGIETKLSFFFFQHSETGVQAGLGLNGQLSGKCGDSGVIVTGSVQAFGTIGGTIDLFGIDKISESDTIFNDSKELFKKTVIDDSLFSCPVVLPPVEGDGTSSGDPHLSTPDHLLMDLQIFGEVILLRSLFNNLLVQVRQGTIPSISNPQVTVNKAIAVRCLGDIIQVQADPRALYINSVQQVWGEPRKLAGGGSITYDGLRSVIQFGTGDRLIVQVYDRLYLDYNIGLTGGHKGKISGILGNFNGDPTDDIKSSNGIAADLNDFDQFYHVFADSWRITDEERIFVKETGRNTAYYTDLSYPKEVYIPDVQTFLSAQTTCINAGISTQPALRNCIYDIGATGETGFAESSKFQQTYVSQAPGPVISYSFDGNLKDVGPWQQNAISAGEIQFVSNRKGTPASALHLSNNSYVLVPNSDVLMGLNREITVSGWHYIESFYGGYAPFICKAEKYDNNALHIEMTSSYVGSGGYLLSFSKPYETLTWHHVAMVLKDNIRTYYIDGEKLGSVSNDVAVNVSNMYFGSDPFGSPEFLNGNIDDVKIYNRALTASEILELYHE